ncbi:MAG: UvrD-helicase domain-containing protein, partial [Planctomycetaceae bacterium]|nr:UvrD-helicase domain-containing protein [Planctomycetaceae bacterium]
MSKSQTIIRASAGSGKTYQLSNTFLRILFDNQDRIGETVSSVLASTFTRKAAGEILDRIFQRLTAAALEPELINNPASEFKREGFPVDPVLLQHIVTEIARNLYKIRICTLDSVFNKIASSFSLELGLPPGWTIIEEAEYSAAVNEAVRRVLQKKPDEINALLPHVQEYQSVRITSAIADLAKQLLPLAQETSAGAWDHEKELAEFTLGKMTEEQLRQHIEPYLNAEQRYRILPQNKPKTKNAAPEPDKLFVKAFDKLIGEVQHLLAVKSADDWKVILKNGLGEKVTNKENRFNRKPVEGELLDFISRIVRHATAIQIEILIHKTKKTRELLDFVQKELEDIMFQKGGYRYDDITFRLGQTFRHSKSTLSQNVLAHRTDTETEHLLLDEFQDTNPQQWSIIRPFTDAVIQSRNSTFFCVGDLKQAVYGWRGGEAAIFDAVERYLTDSGVKPEDIEHYEEMNRTTRRNSQAIIDTVNRVFLPIAGNEAVCKKSGEAALCWANWFGKTEHQTLSKTKGHGCCVFEYVPDEESGDEDMPDNEGNKSDTDNYDGGKIVNINKPFWKHTIKRVADLHRKHPNASIGVLFRAKTNIPVILHGLKKQQGIEASDEAGVPLTDSAAVQQILSVMTLIDHPGDTIARFHLAAGPLACHLPLQKYDDPLEAAVVSRKWRKKLMQNGYGETVKELAGFLSPHKESIDRQRLDKLQELAYRFDSRASGVRTRLFIETVKAERTETQTSGVVRVMTIHGAKGLEFDIVVLPDLTGSLIKPPKSGVISYTDADEPAKPADIVIRYVGDTLQKILPEKYQKVFHQWQANQIKESLAVLYVAMTRARSELVMLVPEKGIGMTKNGEYSATFAGVLHAALAGKFNAPGALPTVLYQTGDPDWFITGGTEAEQKIKPPPVIWTGLNRKRLLRYLPRESPSGKEGGRKEGEDYTPVNRPHTASSVRQPRDAALLGTAVHACFAAVKWIDEMPDIKTLQKIAENVL